MWLVDGDDPTLVSEATRAIVDQLVGDRDRTLTVEEHDGDDVDLAAVADGCRTPPLFSDRRVVVVRDVGRWTTEEVGPLLAYLGDPLPSTCLVLAAGGGRMAAKLVAAVKAHGHVTGTARQGREASAWIRERIRSSPVRLDAAAEHHLEAHLGEDRSRLGSILEVLTSVYGKGAKLGWADIETYLGEAGSVAPWDLTDAIDRGDREVALGVLRRLLTAGERHPLVVLAVLSRQVTQVVRVDGPGVASEADAAAALGIAKGKSTFPAKKALATARRWGPAGAAGAIARLADAELALKGKSDLPGEVILEVLVARLCQLSGASRSARRR